MRHLRTTSGISRNSFDIHCWSANTWKVFRSKLRWRKTKKTLEDDIQVRTLLPISLSLSKKQCNFKAHHVIWTIFLITIYRYSYSILLLRNKSRINTMMKRILLQADQSEKSLRKQISIQIYRQSKYIIQTPEGLQPLPTSLVQNQNILSDPMQLTGDSKVNSLILEMSISL